ncbi:hypothetical protein T265_14283, partial [Opisthorchis viverrini]
GPQKPYNPCFPDQAERKNRRPINYTPQPNDLKRDIHHGTFQKLKHVRPMMARYCHTQFDSTPATVPFLLPNEPTFLCGSLTRTITTTFIPTCWTSRLNLTTFVPSSSLTPALNFPTTVQPLGVSPKQPACPYLWRQRCCLPSRKDGYKRSLPKTAHYDRQRLTVTSGALSNTVAIVLKPESFVLLKRHPAALGMKQQCIIPCAIGLGKFSAAEQRGSRSASETFPHTDDIALHGADPFKIQTILNNLNNSLSGRSDSRRQTLNARNLLRPSPPLDVDQRDNAPAICRASQPRTKARSRSSAVDQVRQSPSNKLLKITDCISLNTMVCIPCIVIPAVLWILHRLLYPLILFLFPGLKERFPFLCPGAAASAEMTKEKAAGPHATTTTTAAVVEGTGADEAPKEEKKRKNE